MTDRHGGYPGSAPKDPPKPPEGQAQMTEYDDVREEEQFVVGCPRYALLHNDGTMTPYFFIFAAEQSEPGVRSKYPVFMHPDWEYEITIKPTGRKFKEGVPYKNPAVGKMGLSENLKVYPKEK